MINTWKCHICGKERPDEKISVFTKSLTVNGTKVGQQHIRYCNDNNECYKQTKTFEFTHSS